MVIMTSTLVPISGPRSIMLLMTRRSERVKPSPLTRDFCFGRNINHVDPDVCQFRVGRRHEIIHWASSPTKMPIFAWDIPAGARMVQPIDIFAQVNHEPIIMPSFATFRRGLHRAGNLIAGN